MNKEITMASRYVGVLFLLFVGLLLSTPCLTAETDSAAGLSGILRYYTLADAATTEGDLEGARRHITDGLALVPSSPHLRLGLARVNLALGDTAACLSALESFAELGTSFDLTTYPPLAEITDLPLFSNVVAGLASVPPPAAIVTVVLNDPDLWTEGIALPESGRRGSRFLG
jgi:hypothetical protein